MQQSQATFWGPALEPEHFPLVDRTGPDLFPPYEPMIFDAPIFWQLNLTPLKKYLLEKHKLTWIWAKDKEGGKSVVLS